MYQGLNLSVASTRQYSGGGAGDGDAFCIIV